MHMIDLPLDAERLLRFAHGQGHDNIDDTGYALHAWLAAAFGALAPKPFRALEHRTGLRLLGYAPAPLAELRAHADDFAPPSAMSACRWEDAASKPMPAQWTTGRRLGFELRACPVSRAERERDVFLVALDRAKADGRELLADKFSVPWEGRRYDRSRPTDADVSNQAINHASTFVEAAADVAVAVVGALQPLGFIHEDSSNAFTLDVTDLYRAEPTVPLAFKVAKRVIDEPRLNLERELRREAAREFRHFKLIPKMIDRIKELFGVDDGGGDEERE